MGPKPHLLVYTLTALAFGDPRGVTCATLRVTCHCSAVELLVKQLRYFTSTFLASTTPLAYVVTTMLIPLTGAGTAVPAVV